MNALPERFEVLELVVDDGVERMLRARDRTLDREVLIKAPSTASGGQQRSDAERLQSLREARALARIDHPGVVRLLDVVETPDGPLLVLRPEAATSLAEELARVQRLAPARVASLMRDVARALAVVHAAGIVHRDVSGRAILLREDGSACLTGFTFAKPHRMAMGTSLEYARPASGASPPRPTYPAPEQFSGATADARSDLFSLGCVAYRAVTGADAFPEDGREHHQPAAPGRTGDAVTDTLSAIIVRCLMPDPRQRPQSAGEVANVLDACLALQGSAPADPEVDAEPEARGRRVRRLTWIAGATVSMLLVTVLVLMKWGEASSSATRGVSLVPDSEQPAVLSAGYGSSYALLIGIGDVYREHRFPVLPNAERDVDAIAERLESMPWERWNVSRLEGRDATRDGIIKALFDLGTRAAADDRLLIYYAGHSEPHPISDRSGWVIPADGLPESEDPAHASWVTFDTFQRQFHESRAKHILLAMDSCYSGRLTVARSVAGRYSERYLREPAHVIITSGRGNEEVSDGVVGDHSPFATAFLDALRSSDDAAAAITSSMLFAGIQAEFDRRGVSHTPQIAHPEGGALGQFVFFLRKPD